MRKSVLCGVTPHCISISWLRRTCVDWQEVARAGFHTCVPCQPPSNGGCGRTTSGNRHRETQQVTRLHTRVICPSPPAHVLPVHVGQASAPSPDQLSPAVRMASVSADVGRSRGSFVYLFAAIQWGPLSVLNFVKVSTAAEWHGHRKHLPSVVLGCRSSQTQPTVFWALAGHAQQSQPNSASLGMDSRQACIGAGWSCLSATRACSY